MEYTHSNSQFFSQPRRHKPKHNPSHSDAHPKPRCSHAACELLAVADFEHELDDPTSERDFDAHVAEEKDGADPSDACEGKADKCFLHAIVLIIASARIRSAECGTVGVPEGGCGGYEFDNGHADLDRTC